MGEKTERERDVGVVKERIENEKKELQICIDKDRDNFNRKMNEEHDQRRIEQMEMQQRLDNGEKAGKNDIAELYNKVRREIEAREAENDEIVAQLRADKSQLEEKIVKERVAFREALENETSDLHLRLDKAMVQQVNDSADVQAKLGMLGKSASRHIEALKHHVFRECQGIFDLMTRPFSVAFAAYRDESYVNGGEEYFTFSGCEVNVGNGMNPKTGEFIAPESGLYLFMLTCCTLDKKKCLMAVRRNGVNVASIHDQDGDENKGKTMIGQNILVECSQGDKVQVYAYTSTGLTDHKNSRYTQFVGMLLRPSVDAMTDVAKHIAAADDWDVAADDDRSMRSSSVRPGSAMGGSEMGRKSSKKGMMSPPPSGSRIMSPLPPPEETNETVEEQPQQNREPKRRSMAEMASSTLKGFAKM